MSASIPHISISLAPPEELPLEPYSPFAATFFHISPSQDDGFRPIHLTPPPTHTKFIRPTSPLRPSQDIANGRGLDRARFEALLKSSEEKLPPAKKPVDLRKEVALKVHKTKQVERRALFLSKVLAPPSPTAAITPKTPPDSPSIFHYTLPSPGLVSPLAHYESLHDEDADGGLCINPCQPWVEQVDFRLLGDQIKTKEHPDPSLKAKQSLPSLDQISARLRFHRSIRTSSTDVMSISSSREESVVAEHPRLVVGRLKMPVRGPKIPAEINHGFPHLPVPSDLEVATLLVPRTATFSPTELTKTNLLVLNSRETRSCAMMSALRRRTQSSAVYSVPPFNRDDIDCKRGWRRHSAPPDTMPLRGRSGFEHPVLALPGGF